MPPVFSPRAKDCKLACNNYSDWIENRLGAERVKQVYPFRSIIDSEVILAGATDAPIESSDLLRAIQVAVTRNNFITKECLTVEEALRIFTYNAAYACRQETIKGSLEEGKLADFVILEKDITKIPSEIICQTKILATYHRGKRIF